MLNLFRVIFLYKFLVDFMKMIFCMFIDEGEYVCSRCTVFGLECDEVQVLVRSGFKMTDCNKEEEGVEVKNSVFKVISA